ncbi:response regulator [Enterococcus faecalis]|uniref:response regulator n=1 Tax=Enterococcus faecalis TaxID=1351 RepID=UPI0018CE50AD|nr:response regulator [Enterococcus faecalis]EGO5015765.1 response regulator [Enterococcus faecalis]EGO6562142.1 response regulator [Enterococcus faecalis]EGO8093204.1 response regulator [Enterococcus faecalis]EIP7780490.1 response regulator [Enterococcus faecalis]EKG2075265.1 response regulator [Enterococcus faecalis]
MEYVYKILVVDDSADIANSFKVYQDFLKDKGFKVEFSLASSKKELAEKLKRTHDILMVDYNLKNGFPSSDNYDGTDFIKEYREKNKISKIIFCSSEFSYDEKNEKKCKLNLQSKEIFDLVNIYKVNCIVSKNNFNMLIDSIAENLCDLDPITKLLIDTKEKYSGETDNMIFTDSNGEEVGITRLLDEYLNDSSIGREFKDQMMKTIVTLLLEYRY